jgi:SAM-dependent methyltransferase
MRIWIYELIYRIVPVDWIFGPSSQLENFVDLAIEGRISSGTVITLGCGIGRESVYLAKKGFQVVGVDFSSTAIQRARRRAKDEGVDVQFVVDDLTNLQHISGTFDMVMDFGALNDISRKARELYMENVMPLMKPRGYYVMFSFDSMLPFDEVMQRFGGDFSIEVLHKGPEAQFPGLLRLYGMTRIT